MKNKILFAAVFAAIVFASCSQGYDKPSASSDKGNSRNIRLNQAPGYLDIPLLNGGKKRVDVVKGYYIVRTKKDFDKSVFIKMGARVEDFMDTKDGFAFWYIYKNDSFFIKRILQVEGVISAEYDFTVYRINPPKRGGENIISPSPIGENLLTGGSAESAFGLEDGDLTKDPRSEAANYSLKITKALDAYKKYKNDHFKKDVLLGIVDTGFNYCHEDFWFKNTKGEDESIAYFVKSGYLLSRATEDFDYSLTFPPSSDTPDISYAKDWLDANRYTRKFFEVPCTKVKQSSPSRIFGHDCPFFWNWDNGSHGTHCTGVMAARGDNDKGVTGVSWKNTKIASYKCFGGQPGGKAWEIYGALADFADYIEAGKAGKLNELYGDATVDGIAIKDGGNTNLAQNSYMTEQEKFEPYKDQGTYPVNMSLGGPFPSILGGTIVQRCLKLGILPVVAMGNDGQRLAEFPASYDGVLSVGATDGRDKKTDFSCSGEWISVCAPGDGILSTGVVPVFNYPFSNFWFQHPWTSGSPVSRSISTSYETMSGTSMATPFVTGVLGYLLTFENAYTKKPGWFKAVLEGSADAIEGQTQGIHNEDHGYGRVNVLKAAKHAKDGTAPSGTAGEFDYSTENYVKFTLRNKRRPKNSTAPLGLSGHPVYVYNDKGDPAAFNLTNNKGEVDFFFLPKRNGADYYARCNINGQYIEKKFNITGSPQEFVMEYDSPVIYISTFTPHSEFFKKYSVDGKYDREPDTIISVYEKGKFDEPVARYDMGLLDTMAFNAVAGKTYYAEITCFQDPTTQEYRNGMYGFRIGFDSNYSDRLGNNDFINPIVEDAGKVQPKSGMKIYELINGQDCWEPNDDFSQADKMGDFTKFASDIDLRTYILGCLTNQSDGLDIDIYRFSVPEYDEHAEE